MGGNPAGSIHVWSGGAWGAAGLGWAGLTPPPGWPFLEIIPRNIPVPGGQIIQPPLVWETQPQPLGTGNFAVSDQNILESVEKGWENPWILVDFGGCIFSLSFTAQPRDFLGIPAHPSTVHAIPSSGIWEWDFPQDKMMNLVLNPGKQEEPTWRFIPGIPGLFPGIQPALSARAFQAQ